MKINFFIYHLRSGGAERVITTLANNFAQQDNDVKIYTIAREKSFYTLVDNVKHLGFGLKFPGVFSKINFLNNIFKLYRHLKADRPDVLVSFIDVNNLIAIIVAKILKIPVVISERSNPEKYNHRKLIRFGFKTLYKKANLIALQTKAVEDSFCRLKINLPKTAVLPNPIANGFLKQIPANKENVILSVGRLSFEKGHDVLLQALVGLDLTGWRVKIVGDGPLIYQYQKFIEENNLANYVTLEGRKTNVIDYYDQAKILVLPSRFEGFPNVLIEAMARGCKVIATDCEYGPSEIIVNNKNGLLFPVDDFCTLRKCIVELCNNEREDMFQNAIETANRYNENKISSDWMNAIKSTTQNEPK